MATPSVNRRKDIFSGVSGLSRKIDVVPEAGEIPSFSAVEVISCTPKPTGELATKRSGQHLSTIHEQTPSRGPLKPIDSRFNLSSTGNRPEIRGRLSGSARDAIPLLKKTDAKHLAAFSPGPFRTPTKIRPIDPQQKHLHEGVEDTPIKNPRDALGTIQEKPTSINAENENNVSIYDRLGWNDIIDELS